MLHGADVVTVTEAGEDMDTIARSLSQHLIIGLTTHRYRRLRDGYLRTTGVVPTEISLSPGIGAGINDVDHYHARISNHSLYISSCLLETGAFYFGPAIL